MKKGALNGDKIKDRVGMSRTGAPVKLPSCTTWLKQPTLITMLSANLSNLHLRILICLIEKIQTSIEQSINKVPYEQLTLFRDSTSDRILIVIKTKDFGVTPDSYPQLRKAISALATIPVEFDTNDPITGAKSWSVSGLFRAYIPKEKHRRTITIEIEKNVAKALVDVEKGFTKYIKEIALQTQSKYTIRIYMLVSSWKDKGGFSITLKRFRKWLGIEHRYPCYKDLYKRVIRPVYEELFERSNCWFEVSEVYKEGENEPYKLNFKVVRAALTVKEEEYLNTHRNNLVSMMINHLKMSDKHVQKILPLISINNINLANEKVIELCHYVRDNWSEITSIPDYAVTSLTNLLSPNEGIIGEED